MNTYQVTVIFGASKSVTVQAESIDDAIEEAYNHDEMSVCLCHQCSSEIEIGDPHRAIVYDETYMTELADDGMQEKQIATLTAKLEAAESRLARRMEDLKLQAGRYVDLQSTCQEQAAQINVLEQSLADSGASKLFGDQLFDVWNLNQGLTEQIEALKVDAERYRFADDTVGWSICRFVKSLGWCPVHYKDIDDAIAKEKS